MPEFEEITQSLLAPELDIFGIERDPQYIGQYLLSNRLTNTIAHLAAVDGKKSRLLSCDDTGQLSVSDTTTHSYLSSVLSVRIQDYDGTYQANVDSAHNLDVSIRYNDSTINGVSNGNSAEGKFGLVVWDFNSYRMYSILDDVWDSVNHALRTVAA